MELIIKDLTKKYGSFIALNHVNMTFTPGVYGILGANGAGKSTLMNLITDNLKRSSGEILYDGEDILKQGARYRKKLGYMPQQQGFYEDFTALQFLHYIGELKGLNRAIRRDQAEELLEQVHLYDVRHEKLKSFSGGMRQRVLLAQALLGNPQIIILDEPSAGLDPRERVHIRNMIASLGRQKIVLISTHIVSDVECIADSIILMRQGQVIAQDTPEALIHSITHHVEEFPCTKRSVSALQKKYPEGILVQRSDGLHYRIVTQEPIPGGLMIPADHLNLEDVYMYYVK